MTTPCAELLTLRNESMLKLPLICAGMFTVTPHTTPMSANVTHEAARYDGVLLLLLLLLPTTAKTFEKWCGNNDDADECRFDVLATRGCGSANLACNCNDTQRVEKGNVLTAVDDTAASRTTHDESVLLLTAT